MVRFIEHVTHILIQYTVNLCCVGETLVSGGADRHVIIWSGNPYEGKLKFSHADAIQKVAYSPVAAQVLICSNVDIGEQDQLRKRATSHSDSLVLVWLGDPCDDIG